MVEITKDYSFDASHGKVGLIDLFEGRTQLLIYHLMFEPDADEACASCSFWIDNVGHLSHFYARDTSFAAVSRAPLDKLERYKQRMGWTIPWYSSYGSDFNYDFHVSLDPRSPRWNTTSRNWPSWSRRTPAGGDGPARRWA